MDGGGRLLEPLTVGYSGGAARAPSFALQGSAGRGRPRLSFPSSWPLGRRGGFVAVPMQRRVPRHLGTGLTLGFFLVIAVYGLVAGGQYDLLRASAGEPRDVAARLLGFGLDRITISGLSQMTEREVLDIAGITPRLSLPSVGAAEIRARLEATPLVRSASVRKLFPNQIVIALVEREPYALWQKDGELNVVSADGTVIDKLRDTRFSNLPLVVGADANGRAADYIAILAAAGPLAERIRAGMLVSGRRWTLKMDNGIDVHLPEQGAVDAVQRLARLARDQKILDKDVLSIDLRIADRVVVRLSEEAAAAHAELVKKRPARGTKGMDT